MTLCENDCVQLVANNSAEFMKQFLKRGGLQMIVNILQNEVVSEMVENQTEVEIRRGCYTTALTIARFVFLVPSINVGSFWSRPVFFFLRYFLLAR